MADIYQEHGYANRTEYLHCIANDYGVDLSVVETLAEVLGEGEDFDGLISLLDDHIDDTYSDDYD